MLVVIYTMGEWQSLEIKLGYDSEVFVLKPLILLYRSEGILAFVFRKLSI